MHRFNIDKLVNDAASWLVVSMLGIVAWLVRTILTNNKKIEMLEADLKRRESARDEDRERMAKLEAAIERVEGILLHVAQKQL